MREFLLFLSVFIASLVEGVEALTIVLAVGTTRSWKSAIYGVFAALLSLGVVISALGPAINTIPLNALRLVIGGLLLIFGLQWLRKAILRASGYIALHDEDEIYKNTLEDAKKSQKAIHKGFIDDWYSFTISFKGVFLEGLEVAFIVVTFGANQKSLSTAIYGAVFAVLVVVGTGLIIHKPLSKVPENGLKFIVGIMLTSFGIFWGSEGAGIHWPGNDLALIVIVLVILVTSIFDIYWLEIVLRRRLRT